MLKTDPVLQWPNLESLASNRYKLLLLGLPGAGSSFVKLVLPKSSTLAGAIYDPHIDYVRRVGCKRKGHIYLPRPQKSQNTPHIADHRNSGVFFYETPSAPDILVCAANENQARKEDESVAYIMAIFSRFTFDRVILLCDCFTNILTVHRDETSPYILKIETGRQDSAASSTSYIPHLDPTVLVRGAAAAALSQVPFFLVASPGEPANFPV